MLLSAHPLSVLDRLNKSCQMLSFFDPLGPQTALDSLEKSLDRLSAALPQLTVKV